MKSMAVKVSIRQCVTHCSHFHILIGLKLNWGKLIVLSMCIDTECQNTHGLPCSIFNAYNTAFK